MTGSMPTLDGTLRAALCAIATVAVLSASALAQAAKDTDAFAPVDEYARKVEEFAKTAPELNRKIEEGTKAIEGMADVPKARKELEQLRGAVADLLGRVSDDGDLARLGARALDQSRNKLKALEQDSRFTVEERGLLIGQWRELIRQTEAASADLDRARLGFVELLRTLQTREDFIDELLQIRRAAEALKVIRQLTSDLRDASDKLKTLIGGIKPPGV
jgi:hypothetical protein